MGKAENGASTKEIYLKSYNDWRPERAGQVSGMVQLGEEALFSGEQDSVCRISTRETGTNEAA